MCYNGTMQTSKRKLSTLALTLGAIALAGCSPSTYTSPADKAPRGAYIPPAASATTNPTNQGSTDKAPSTGGYPPNQSTIPVASGHGWTSSGLDSTPPSPGSCHSGTGAQGYALPDPVCTPGAVDTAVTQSNLQDTICHHGYTKTVRPPYRLTEKAKRASMQAYGETGSTRQYEFDHLLPLELAGSSDIRNLWSQPDQGKPSQFDTQNTFGINAKDGVEDRLNAAVCSGQVQLAAAQQAIVHNWTTAEQVLGVTP